ncbi:helix-turn-helix transcriptional regulator [Sphingobium aromaticiconvertens]|uniref:helix-turn-helix transcriptional regulator n=1 Tax=Sphingobium aromaticiconvertens TaxID=365341 RepID=UPI0030199978
MRIFAAEEADLLVALADGIFEEPLWGRFLALLHAKTRAACVGVFIQFAGSDAILERVVGNPLPSKLSRISHLRWQEDATQWKMREGRVYAEHELMDLEVRKIMGPDRPSTSGPIKFMRSVQIAEVGGGNGWITLADKHDLSAATGSLLHHLAPHFRVALRSLTALKKERARASLSEEVIGQLNFGWLMLDSQCRIVNSTANIDSLLRRTDALRRGPHDRLLFRAPDMDQQIAKLVADFATGASRRPQPFTLGDDPWTDIFVTPARNAPSGDKGNAVAIIYVNGDRWSQQDRCGQLVDLFGLLPSEARLAWTMAQGRSISEAATDLEITLETARNYSKKIYSKMGVRGQAELVHVILTSALAVI